MIVLIRISLTEKSVTGARTRVIYFRCGVRKQEDRSGEARKKKQALHRATSFCGECGLCPPVTRWGIFWKSGEGSLISQDSSPWSNGFCRSCPNSHQFLQAEPAPSASGRARGRNEKQEDKPKGDWMLEMLLQAELTPSCTDSDKGVLQSWKGACYSPWIPIMPFSVSLSSISKWILSRRLSVLWNQNSVWN